MEGIISNQIIDLDNEEVEELNLEGWRATSISVQDKKLLEKYENLDYLSLPGCGLKTLENFPALKKLIKLDLNDNEIKGHLEALAGLKDLMQLNLANNHLTTIENFQPLADMNTLVYLEIKGNPVTNVEGYRQKLFHLVPSLQVIDDLDKNGNEVSLFSDDDDDELDNDLDDDDEFGDSDDEELDDDDDDDDQEDSESEEVPKKRPKGPPAKDQVGKKK